MRPLVLDTNIVLDLLVFQDAATAPLRWALQQQDVVWLATAPMRDELERVLGYPQIVRQWQKNPAQSMPSMLARFDAQASIRPVAPRAPVSCRDPDDQKFIDLAVAHQTLLLSRDQAVLFMRKRLLALGVLAVAAIF
ncbi:MAG: putative toxin-antitoxin system toxin component, PIN family [Rhodoferax sp.]